MESMESRMGGNDYTAFLLNGKPVPYAAYTFCLISRMILIIVDISCTGNFRLINYLEATEVSISGLKELADVFELKIPFLSPPNQAWPKLLDRVPWSNFGLLERGQNSVMIELWVPLTSR